MPKFKLIDYLNQVWYANIDDCIGGWMIANVDKRASGIDVNADERVVGEFLDENTARHIADLHNKHLDWIQSGKEAPTPAEFHGLKEKAWMYDELCK